MTTDTAALSHDNKDKTNQLLTEMRTGRVTTTGSKAATSLGRLTPASLTR